MSSAMSAIGALLDSMGSIQRLQSFSILMAAFDGIMFWELVTCFPSEAKHIFWPDFLVLVKKGKCPPLASILLFNARLLVIPIIAVSFAAISPSSGMGMTGDFNSLFKAYVFLFSAAVFNGTAVFVIRTLAIRDSKRPMTIFFWCFFAAICIFHLICAGLVEMPAGFLLLDSNQTPLKSYLPWILFVGCSVAFDIVVLGLSIAPQVEGWKWKPTYSHIAKRFYYDAIIYFANSLVVSLFDFAWIVKHRYDGLLVALATPIHIWLLITISPRVIRNLRLHSAKQKAGASRELSKERSPFNSGGSHSLPFTGTSISQTCQVPSSVFVISKERTSNYPSSLCSTTNTTPPGVSTSSMV